jgi:hypothetical protein
VPAVSEENLMEYLPSFTFFRMPMRLQPALPTAEVRALAVG